MYYLYASDMFLKMITEGKIYAASFMQFFLYFCFSFLFKGTIHPKIEIQNLLTFMFQTCLSKNKMDFNYTVKNSWNFFLYNLCISDLEWHEGEYFFFLREQSLFFF